MSPIAIFFIAAIVVNVVTYGGITAMYIVEERRVDPPRDRNGDRMPERPATSVGTGHHDSPHSA